MQGIAALVTAGMVHTEQPDELPPMPSGLSDEPAGGAGAHHASTAVRESA